MLKKFNPAQSSSLNALLWIAAAILLIVMLFARVVFPDQTWLTIIVALALLGTLGVLIQRNRSALRGRTVAYGVNSAVTVVLVVAIVGVANFLASRYPLKADLTKNKLHTLSDQTVKLVKGLNKPVKAVFFANMQGREQSRPLLESYKGLSTKFELEFVDPTREPTRAKQLGIKRLGTLHLAVGARDSTIEDITEEKLTNALIKLMKDKSPLLCSITGHGEKQFSAQAAEGYSAAKKALNDQAYEVKEVNLAQEGKLPENCDAIAILGPSKSFLQPEAKMVQDYLAHGGRALIALDPNLKGGEYAPEIASIMESWNVKPLSGIIVDPLSKMFGVDAAAPIVATYSQEQAITKEFQANMIFPFVRPIEAVSGAPAGMNVQWIAKTTPKSWSVTDPKQLATGEVRFTEGKDRQGPLSIAVTVEGKQKDSKASRSTRIVAFGSSFFAANSYSRFGGNLDFFLNSASWLMEDESLISIRAKEEGESKIELSQQAGAAIFLVSVIVLPLLIAAGGVYNWARRRKL